MGKKDLLLSVIVPIYNVEKYLEQCIDSLLLQTYPSLEIILVDDGSPDKSGIICDEYSKMDKRIRVFHNSNRGVCHARNYGLQNAFGEYIAFIDGDDYLPNENSLLVLMDEAIKSKSDIIIGNYHKDIEGKLIPTNPHEFDTKTDTSTANFRFRGFYSSGHLSYVWGKIYKLSFIIDNDLAMKPFDYSEDKLFNVECYINHPKYSFVYDYVYVYRFNNISVSNKYIESFSEIWIELSQEMYRDMNNIEVGREYYDIVAFNLFYGIFFSSKQEYIASGYNRSAVKEELTKYATNDLVKLLLKNLAKGKYIRFISSNMWKGMIWSFSLGFTLRQYGLLSLGIKYLIDWNIDGKLSSTGRTNKRNGKLKYKGKHL